MAKEKKEENQELFEETNSSQDDSSKSESDESNEKSPSRMDAAKAFFRAMYAGSDESQEEAESTPAQDARPSGPPVSSRQMEDLQSRLKEAEHKVVEAETLYKRMAADFDNYRRRIDREREELMSYGTKKTVETLLPALDDLDRAISVLSADTPSDKLVESFKLVANRIVGCLEQAGVKRLNTEGQVFDPVYHEPVQQIETSEFPDGVVMQELRGGYMLNDKVVRPALVNVASNSGEVAPAHAESSVDEIEVDNNESEANNTSENESSDEADSHQKNKKSDDDEDNVKVYEIG